MKGMGQGPNLELKKSVFACIQTTHLLLTGYGCLMSNVDKTKTHSSKQTWNIKGILKGKKMKLSR